MNYKRPIITQGNDFTIKISLQQFLEGEYVDFDITQCKSVEVYLVCSAHNTKIPLDWEIVDGYNYILSCFVDARLLHSGTSYGICVEGKDANEKQFRWYMLPKEGILVVTNTSGQNIPQDVETIDLVGRVGFGIQTDADLTNYYTKTEVNNLIDESTDNSPYVLECWQEIDEDLRTTLTDYILNSRDIILHESDGGELSLFEYTLDRYNKVSSMVWHNNFGEDGSAEITQYYWRSSKTYDESNGWSVSDIDFMTSEDKDKIEWNAVAINTGTDEDPVYTYKVVGNKTWKDVIDIVDGGKTIQLAIHPESQTSKQAGYPGIPDYSVTLFIALSSKYWITYYFYCVGYNYFEWEDFKRNEVQIITLRIDPDKTEYPDDESKWSIKLTEQHTDVIKMAKDVEETTEQVDNIELEPNQNELVLKTTLDSTPKVFSRVGMKTINNQSILGEGNINIEGGTGSSPIILTYGVTNNIPEDLLEQAQNGRTIICQYITVTAATWDIEGYLMGQTIKFEKYYTLGNVPRLIEVILMKNNNNQWQWSNNVSEYYNKSQTNNLINTLENNTNDLVDGVKSNVHTLAESTIKQFNEINKSVDEVVNEIPNKVNEKIDELNNDLSSKDKVTAEALNHINQRVEALEEDGGSMPTNYVESFNGQTGAVTYTAPVTSVNGQTGAVTLSIPTNTSDLNNDSGFLTSAPVTSVNGATGAVTLSIPTNTSDLTNDSGFLTSAPVSSVNGQTGAVNISIPTNTSDLNNDSGFLTSAPVTSVNSQTGAVNISIPTNTSDLTNDSGFIVGNNLYTIRTNVIESIMLSSGKLRIIFGFDLIKDNQIILSTNDTNNITTLQSLLTNLGFDDGIYLITGTGSSNEITHVSYFGEILGHKCFAILLNYIPDMSAIAIALKYNDVYYKTDSISNGKYNYNYLNNKPTIPTNTSDLNNDSGFLTSAPVTSVNGQTGAVNISIPDTTGMVTSSQTGLRIEVVSALPSSPDSNTIYIIQ